MGEAIPFYRAQFVGNRVLMKRHDFSEGHLQPSLEGYRQRCMQDKHPSHGLTKMCIPREYHERATQEFLRIVRELNTDPTQRPHQGSETFSRAFARAKAMHPSLFQLTRCTPVDDDRASDLELV